jgi:hypothetical protein
MDWGQAGRPNLVVKDQIVEIVDLIKDERYQKKIDVVPRNPV